ncbi:MAG: HNH endonuclease [Candidatus Sedimenticola sp. (ex Thyasira tokunagai)]
MKQARLLKCTGEHLSAHSEGGTTSRANIAAACWYCNNRRHRRRSVTDPQSYKAHVRKRMSKGRWHPVKIVEH